MLMGKSSPRSFLALCYDLSRLVDTTLLYMLALDPV